MGPQKLYLIREEDDCFVFFFKTTRKGFLIEKKEKCSCFVNFYIKKEDIVSDLKNFQYTEKVYVGPEGAASLFMYYIPFTLRKTLIKKSILGLYLRKVRTLLDLELFLLLKIFENRSLAEALGPGLYLDIETNNFHNLIFVIASGVESNEGVLEKVSVHASLNKEVEVLKKFLYTIQNKTFDFIRGYNRTSFDYPVLKKRFKYRGLPFPLDVEVDNPPLILDPLLFIRQNLALKDNSLGFIATHLLKENKTGLSLKKGVAYELSQNFDNVLKYCEQDAVLVQKLCCFLKLREYCAKIRNANFLPIGNILTRKKTFSDDVLLFKICLAQNYLAPLLYSEKKHNIHFQRNFDEFTFIEELSWGFFQLRISKGKEIRAPYTPLFFEIKILEQMLEFKHFSSKTLLLTDLLCQTSPFSFPFFRAFFFDNFGKGRGLIKIGKKLYKRGTSGLAFIKKGSFFVLVDEVGKILRMEGRPYIGKDFPYLGKILPALRKCVRETIMADISRFFEKLNLEFLTLKYNVVGAPLSDFAFAMQPVHLAAKIINTKEKYEDGVFFLLTGASSPVFFKHTLIEEALLDRLDYSRYIGEVCIRINKILTSLNQKEIYP
jgi:hypothetical protein